MSEHVEPPEPPFVELEALARPATEPRPAQGPWHARLVAHLLGYLPVLLMGLLAGFTWWLVKNTPVPETGKAPELPPQAADYTMTGFVLASYGPDGALHSQLEGERLQHFPATDMVEVQGVRLRSVDAAGRLMRGSAERAESDGGGARVRLIGNARVSREAGEGPGGSGRIEIRGDYLEVLRAEQRVRSDRPVTLLTGNGELRAGSLDYSRRDRVAELGGRVTGQLRPTPARR